jgi:hypothetical protein
MGSSLRKVSPKKKNEFSKEEIIEEETTQEKKPLKEKEKEKEKEEEEDAGSYFEFEDGTHHSQERVSALNDNPGNLMKSRNLFGSISRKGKKFTSKNNNLFAEIKEFRYQLPDGETISSAKISWPILKNTKIDNKSPVSISHKINYSEIFNEIFRYEFTDKFIETFEEIEVDRNVPLTIEVDGAEHHLDISLAVRDFVYSSQTENYDKYCQAYTNHSNISIEKCIEIPANSSIEIQTNQKMVKNLKIPFTAELVISRRKGKHRFSGESIKSYLKTMNLTNVSVHDFSITTQVNGILTISFGLETLFSVNTL